MDKEKNHQLKDELAEFLSKVRSNFPLDEAILFGSRAKGTEKSYSDYDLILVSKKFKDVRWHRRIEEVVRFWDSDRDIDVLPYTPEEFMEKKQSRCIVQQAVREGVAV
ncbi:MAG: nucleotidyltransferase domain-containing protein [Candidatus Altiarchaeota archaeon]